MTGTVGVLALQGSYNEHLAVLRRLGVKGVQVRKPEHLQDVGALIIPGGESTTMAKLAEYHNLFPALRDFVRTGKPVWGTCAGLIFLANKAVGQKSGGQELVGGLDCTVHRNFFGSQLESFETDLAVPELAAKEGGPATFRGVFIRAPAVLEAGPHVEILASYSFPSAGGEEEGKVIVAVKQGNLLGTAFHPELTADSRWSFCSFAHSIPLFLLTLFACPICHRHTFFLKLGYWNGDAAASTSAVVQDGGPTPIDLPVFV